jgi:hypothetical protein
MAMIRLSPDLEEFLKLLNGHMVSCLLVGGYTVGYFDYPRINDER